MTAAVVGSRTEAQLMIGMLKTNGIHATMSADDAGGVELALQAQGVRVLVAETDAAKARRLIGEKKPEPVRLNRFQRWVVRALGGKPET